LHAAGLIPDPYWGQNEYDLRWICARDWVATRQFMLDDTDVDLVLNGLDTVATVRVNDHVVLEARNAFRDYRVALKNAARKGENTISVTFHSPVAAGRALQDAHDFELPHSKNCPIPFGNFLRKPACDFGWDWNIALAPFGIYGTMDIAPSQAPRIDRLAIAQTHHTAGVTVTVDAYVSHYSGTATLELDGQTYEAEVTQGQCQFAAKIKDPALWWPAGQGAQPLYALSVTAGAAVETRQIGLRDIQLMTEQDADGLGFVFRINGRDIFCKGANWIPADALPSAISDEKTHALLESAVEANMNMIRVWGGGRYEPTSFYESCDALGLLVWQDFMFACNLYPSDRAFLTEVAAEVQDNVARLHHHACIALWCGDNELIGALGWYDCSLADRDRYLVNYDRLNRAVEDALVETAPNANWWPSSPSPGLLNFGDAWHDDGSGDMHFWSVWHEGRDFDHYRDVAPRFCSEFGFQSYPSMTAINRFADPKDPNIAAPVLESHQKNDGGNARIAETMFRYFRWPERFADFVYLSQVQQGLAIKTAVTHWRASKPRCMGTLFWQLNDTWPVCSWASLNHGGDWKLLHHMAQDFYAPQIVSVVPMGQELVLRGVNDAPEPVEISATVRAVNTAGQTRDLDTAQGVVGHAAQDMLALPESMLKPDEMLLVDWMAAGQTGRVVHAPKPYKAYDLLDPKLTITPIDGGVKITSHGLSLFTALEPDQPGRMSANAFDMLPGESRDIIFHPRQRTKKTPQFTLRNLFSATMI
jgi:beta-mannosidase